MPEIGDPITLLDVARRLDPGGSIALIAEMMNQTNEIIWDMPMVEGNLLTGHRSSIRNGLPIPTWRKLNYGVEPSKSTTTVVTDTCGILEATGKVDEEIAKINGNTAAFRLSEDRAFIEAINQEYASMLFYGDTALNPERILGLAPRYAAPSLLENQIGYNLIDGGGVGAFNTSIWLLVLGKETIHGIYPKGSKAGLEAIDMGIQLVNDDQIPPRQFRAYVTWYKFHCGLVVKDWKYGVRICNVDVNDLATAGLAPPADVSANLTRLMIKAINKVPNLNMGKPVFYCNRHVYTALQIQLLNKANAFLSMEEITGSGGIARKRLTFMGIPVSRVDRILSTEAAIPGPFAA